MMPGRKRKRGQGGYGFGAGTEREIKVQRTRWTLDVRKVVNKLSAFFNHMLPLELLEKIKEDVLRPSSLTLPKWVPLHLPVGLFDPQGRTSVVCVEPGTRISAGNANLGTGTFQHFIERRGWGDRRLRYPDGTWMFM